MTRGGRSKTAQAATSDGEGPTLSTADEGAPRAGPSIASTVVPHRVAVEVFEDEGECLLYSPTRDEASALNRTATEIWQLCDGLRSIGAIAALLATRYGVDTEMVLDDVADACSALQARGLIEFTRGTDIAGTPGKR